MFCSVEFENANLLRTLALGFQHIDAERRIAGRGELLEKLGYQGSR